MRKYKLTALLLCAAAALGPAVKHRSREWMLLVFFFGSWALDDLFWLLCQIFFSQSPILEVVADLSWYASYIFLYLLIRQVAPPHPGTRLRFLPWLAPVFTFGMAVFYMQWADYASNLIYASLMGLLMFASIRRLLDRERYREQYFLSAVTLIFCLLEYGLWTASCYWKDDILTNPYYWFDFLLTLCFPFFIVGTRKAVKE